MFNSKRKYWKLAIAVRVPQKTQNFGVYLGARTFGVFLCFVLFWVGVCCLEFFVFLVLHRWRVSVTGSYTRMSQTWAVHVVLQRYKELWRTRTAIVLYTFFYNSFFDSCRSLENHNVKWLQSAHSREQKLRQAISHMSNTPDLSRVVFTRMRIESDRHRNRKGRKALDLWCRKKDIIRSEGFKMLANRLDRIRWRQFVLARVNRTHLKSVGEKERKYLSVTRRNKRATHEIYVVLKAMRM